MSNPKIIVVVPTVRPTQYQSFLSAWKELFEKHEVTLVTVWDGETPYVRTYDYGNSHSTEIEYHQASQYDTYKSLIYRYTDACRNLGFIVASHLKPDYVLTLDDDVAPPPKKFGRDTYNDPIQSHLDVLKRKAPLSWMNTAHDSELYLRGVPYDTRGESPVMLSHGVWVGTPDFDGETQLKLEVCNQCEGSGWVGKQEIGTYRGCTKCASTGKQQVPYSLPYYVGAIPKGVLFPLCGMNVMVRVEALPYLYFAPMGVDVGIIGNGSGRTEEPNKTSTVASLSLLNRFSDIWMGIALKREFDRLGWTCYTGGSTILHTRASDAQKNYEQEKLGRIWNEYITEYMVSGGRWTPDLPSGFVQYMTMWREKREQFQKLVSDILSKSVVI